MTPSGRRDVELPTFPAPVLSYVGRGTMKPLVLTEDVTTEFTRDGFAGNAFLIDLYRYSAASA
jgi:hypothetical protein